MYDTAVRYLDDLKSGGEAITPKIWRSESERLTIQKNALYQQMRAMREDIKSVEKIRKIADQLAKTEKTKNKKPEHEH